MKFAERVLQFISNGLFFLALYFLLYAGLEEADFKLSFECFLAFVIVLTISIVFNQATHYLERIEETRKQSLENLKAERKTERRNL